MEPENSLITALNVTQQLSWQGEGGEHLKWKLLRVTLRCEADTLHCKEPVPETPSPGSTEACVGQPCWSASFFPSAGPLLSFPTFLLAAGENAGFSAHGLPYWPRNKDYEHWVQSMFQPSTPHILHSTHLAQFSIPCIGHILGILSSRLMPSLWMIRPFLPTLSVKITFILGLPWCCSR